MENNGTTTANGAASVSSTQASEQGAGKHSPGPWHFFAPRREVHHTTSAQPIASLKVSGVLRNEAEANGRLIAAAPELLMALHEAWSYVPEHHGPVQHRIRAAIAKATGAS